MRQGMTAGGCTSSSRPEAFSSRQRFRKQVWLEQDPHNPATPFSRRIAVMLVLSRKVGERLVIGDNITVVVSRVAGNRVMIGIEAPSDVRIIRGELKAFANTPTAALAAAPGGFDHETDTATASLPRLAK